MLVLTRKHQEAVVISSINGFEQLLKVTVLGFRGGSVKLGFEAGDEIPIHRAEVWDRIRAEIQALKPMPNAPGSENGMPTID